MKIVALAKIKYNGKIYVCGDAFECNEKESKRLLSKNVVKKHIDTFDEMAPKELKALAKKLGLNGYSNKNKGQLIDMIRKTLTEDTSEEGKGTDEGAPDTNEGAKDIDKGE